MKAQSRETFAPVLTAVAAAVLTFALAAPAAARPAADPHPRLPRAERLDARETRPSPRSPWIGQQAREGVSLDPNGKGGPVPPPAAPVTPGDRLDEGCSLDPDGGS